MKEMPDEVQSFMVRDVSGGLLAERLPIEILHEISNISSVTGINYLHARSRSLRS